LRSSAFARKEGGAIEITLIMTERCNLRCTYCYQKAFTPASMPAATAVAALRAAAAHGAESLAITFFGGEPLLERPTLFEVLHEARKLEKALCIPVSAKVSTNGLLVDEAFIEDGHRLGLFVSLSIDGIRAAHDLGRRTPDGLGSFEAADRALGRLSVAGRPFATYSVVTPGNVALFAESVRYLWDRGARIIVNTADATATWDEASLREMRRQFKITGKFYRRLLERKEAFHLEPFDSRISHRTRAGEHRRCQPGLHQVVVAPDGVLYGCIEYYHRRLEPLGAAPHWVDPVRVRLLARSRRGRPAECGACGIRDRCNNACSCVNLRGTGRPNCPPESLCLTEQETVRTVDAVAGGIFKRKVPEFLMRQYSCSYHVLSGIEKLIDTMEVDHEPVETR